MNCAILVCCESQLCVHTSVTAELVYIEYGFRKVERFVELLNSVVSVDYTDAYLKASELLCAEPFCRELASFSLPSLSVNFACGHAHRLRFSGDRHKRVFRRENQAGLYTPCNVQRQNHQHGLNLV